MSRSVPSFRLHTTSIRPRSVQQCRAASSANNDLHFYRNKQLELYASRKTNRLTLRQLVYFGRSMDEQRLIKSANYVRTELPVRLAHRIRDLQSLPYIVVTEEHIAKVYDAYWSAFDKIRNFPPINSLTENLKFCGFLRHILNEHLPIIPQLSLGLSISSPHLAPDELDSFMRRMLVSRISRRVLAEHHLALTQTLAERDPRAPPHVGIIYTDLSVKKSVNKCIEYLRSREGMYGLRRLEEPSLRGSGIWPEIVVDGHVNTRVSYIREHLEYIIFELLKNAIRFTALNMKANPTAVPGQIRATISADERDIYIRISDQGGGLNLNELQAPSDLFSFSHHRNSERMSSARMNALRRMSDHEHGLPITVDDQMARWRLVQSQDPSQEEPETVEILDPKSNSKNEVDEERASNRMGLGLPLSNIYASYFGGSLDLISLDGWGTDVYLRLPRLGKNLEGLEV